MPQHKPIAGYPSITAAVMALEAQGLSWREIADRLGIDSRRVISLGLSRKNAKKFRTVSLPLATLQGLKPHATRRGISAVDLAARIVEVTLVEGLIDSVLDDLDGER